MKTSLGFLLVVATLAPGILVLRHGDPSAPKSTALPPHDEGTRLLGRLPVAFVPNLGQWEHPASYVARFGAMTVFLHENGWTFTLVDQWAGGTGSVLPKRPESRVDREPKAEQRRGVAVRMSFVGARAREQAPESLLPGRHNYFLGNDSSRWRSDVPLYGSVCYHQLYAGVDVRVREQGGHLEYDLLLAPEAQLGPIEVAVEGVEGVHLDRDGALVMETQLGSVRMPAPATWEEGPSGEKSPVACRYVLRGEKRFGFEVIGRRPGWALTVDPGLVWSTFLGGANDENAYALALDAQGGVTIAGSTLSADFPTTLGAFDTTYNGSDAFVTRLSPSGSSLVYSTFLGTSSAALAIALDTGGAAYVAGSTTSGLFPTTPGAFDTSFNGGRDAFVTRLSAAGSSLVYSTFLGGANVEYAYAIALDSQGAATVAGVTASANFPTTVGAFDTSFHGANDAFVTRLSPSGLGLVYSTFLGGTNQDRANAVALDAQGAATIAGFTNSSDFPATAGAFDTSWNGSLDVFVTRLSPTGSSLAYSTFLGGASNDSAWTLALDSQGAATVAGLTAAGDFPTTPGAFDTSFNGGGSDAFVTRLSASGSSLVYSTFLGGANGGESGNAIVVDSLGAATIMGWTSSSDFRTTPGAFDTTYNGGQGDTFVTRLSPNGSSLVYSTFLGGTGDDLAAAIALDAQGAATVAGSTLSADFPTTPGALDPTYNGGTLAGDAFVTRLDLLPTGVSAFGRSSPGCSGPLAISATSMPRVGNAGFAVTCGSAPPSTVGLCGLTVSRFSSPVSVLGVDLWVDPAPVFVSLTANSNNLGASEVPLPVPNNAALVGGRLFTQFLWAGPTVPPPCPPQGFSASNALEVVVQP